MRSLAAIFFVTTAAFAQVEYDNHIRLEKADGSEIAIPVRLPSDDVIVEFRDEPVAIASASQHRATLARFRADLASVAASAEVRWEYSRVLHGVAMRVPRAAIPAIARLPYVRKVHEDRDMQAMAGAAVDQIRAAQVWTTFGTRGKGVVVAVLDTGVDYNHEALGKGFGPGHKVIGGYDFANKDNDPLDDNGHGTHVAGIIAGDSLSITGVAPEASIVAYKVLRSTGSGKESDVIAAIEVATDPNGDNDTSDHVDVINLSLGSHFCEGHPDDASARAVDNASRAGVIVAVAAGNEAGKYHCISSPGLARTAITVGAVDGGDAVASFSSRGPAQRDLTMKPDIGAPGVSILSSTPGNNYGLLSGTSMATPHVAGAAALLRALHRDWTPAQIKNALMINAGFTNQETMASGTGRLDVLHAASSKLSVDKPSLDFGLDNIQQGRWASSRTLRLTNRGDQSATWNVNSSDAAGIVVKVSPPSLTLAAGASGDVTLSIDVDNSVAAVSAKSLAGGGVLTLTSGSESAYVPWTFVKAARATVNWEKDSATIVFLDAGRTTQFEAAPLESNSSEVLLAAAGLYDVFVFGSTMKNGVLTRASFIYLETALLSGDITINTTEAQASRVIRGATTTPDGKPLLTAADQTYALAGRLVWPAQEAQTFKSMAIPALPLHELYVNDVRTRHTLLMNETFVDFYGNAIYAVQHPPMKGLSTDVTLTAGQLKSADVQLLVSPYAINPRIVTQVAPSGVTVTRPYADTVWNGRLYLTPDADPAYAAGVRFTVAGDGNTFYETPTLRMADGQITANASSVPWWYSGSRFVFGTGPRFATVGWSNISTTLRPMMIVDLFGALGDTRPNERVRTAVATYGADGKLRTSVIRYPAPMDFSVKGKYTVEATNDGTQFPDLLTQTKVTMTLDSARVDYVPPTVTTLFILDEAGRATRTVTPRGSAAIYFSAADYDYTPLKTYGPVRGEATKIWYRYAGTTAWTPLTVTQTGEDAGAEGRLGTGLLFRADLREVANMNWARVDLKVDLADAAGNTTSMIIAPAFSVGGEFPPKRRSAR